MSVFLCESISIFFITAMCVYVFCLPKKNFFIDTVAHLHTSPWAYSTSPVKSVYSIVIAECVLTFGNHDDVCVTVCVCDCVCV